MTDIPQHIGFIVDGNRRWAKKHGLPAYEGHLAGYNAIRDILTDVFGRGIQYVSAYTFSTENWKRSQDEISHIMSLMIRMLTADIGIFQENNIRLRVAGAKNGLSQNILKAIENAEQATEKNTRGTFVLCFNYGGQLEIVDAIKEVIKEETPIAEISVDTISRHLYVPEVPPVDLVVRTSGEQRLSNFMLWRAAYSEFIFLEKLWPDMTKDDVTAILEEYTRRGRRFGG